VLWDIDVGTKIILLKN